MSEIVGIKIEINGEQKIVQSVGEMRKLLKEAQFEALALSSQFGETSKEALDAAKRVAMLKDGIADTSERIGLFDPGKKFQVFTNTLSTAAGGVAALQGAMGLLGGESEAVQQSLLKVQSALALSQGLSVIADGAKDFQRLGGFIQQSTVFIKANEFATKAAAVTMKLFGVAVETTSVSFKVLKGAIAATGIGLLVIALGEAISFMQNYTSATEDAAKAQADLNKQISSSAKVALDAELKTLDQKQKLLLAEFKAKGATEKEIFDLEQSYRALKSAALSRYYVEVKDADAAAAKDAINDIENNNIEILVAQENFNEQKKIRDKAAREKAEEERATAQKEALNKQYQAELNAYNQRVKLRGKEQQEVIDASLTLSEKRAAQKKKDEEQAKIDAEQLELLQNSILGKGMEKQISLLAFKQDEEKKFSQRSIEIAQKEADAKLLALQATAQALMNLSLIAGRETASGKALAIAASLINTYAAIAGQLKAFSGIPIPGYAIVQAVATGLAGLAAVKNIVSVQVPGGGSGGANINPSLPSLSSGSPLTPSSIAANQVTLDQRSINAMGNQAIRAYVIESEISSAQQKIRRIQRQTTFG